MLKEKISFDLNKYKSTIYKKNNIEHLLCLIRKKLIVNSNEEKVRQAIISFLINDLGIDPAMIDVEVNISVFKNHCKDRADVIVYTKRKNKDVPLLLIECKAENIVLNNNVWEQAERYNQYIKAPFIFLTNGIDYEFYSYNKKKKEYNLLEEIPNYNQLITGQDLIYDKTQEWVRPEFENINNQESIDEFIGDGHIGNYTLDRNPKLIPFIINFGGFLYDSRIFKSKNIGTIKLIEDLGVMHRSFGNSSGGNFDGFYRSFMIQNNKIIHIGIIAQADERRVQGKTILVVAIDNHNSLQLSLDKSSTINNNNISISHNGRMTCGNKGAVPKIKVINFIKNEDPYLYDKYNQIIDLGKFNLLNEINWETEGTEIFIEKLIKYALLRDEFRKLYSIGKI